MLDEDGAQLLGPRYVALRRQMIEIRRFVKTTWALRNKSYPMELLAARMGDMRQ